MAELAGLTFDDLKAKGEALWEKELGKYTLYAEKLDGKNWTALTNWPGITKNSCTVDLEKYQGATLRFYVVANAVDKSKYCSPNGEYSNPLLVETRLAAPEVTAAKLSYQTPSQTQFLTEEKLTLTVDNSASSVSEIAQEVGFGDASNFSTRFAKATGQSPLQYRKSALKPVEGAR